jgi:hypothetical protein
MIKFKYNIMKNLKLFLLIFIAAIFITSAESFAYPRHRIWRVTHRVRPVYRTTVVRTYYVVKKPKIYHRHHKRVIRRVIYY